MPRSSQGQTICHREIPDPAITAVLDRRTVLHRNGLLYDVRRQIVCPFEFKMVLWEERAPPSQVESSKTAKFQ